MKKRIFILTTLAAVSLVGNDLALAGNKANEFTVSLQDSYYHFAKKRSLDNVAVPNVALAYNFTRQWAMELDAGLINTNLNPPKVAYTTGVHGYLFTADALYRFAPCKVFEPYVSFGIGEMTLSPNGVDATHQANINGGVGTQLFFDEDIAFRAEARDLYTMSGGKNDYMLNVGISILLDNCLRCCHPSSMPTYKGAATKNDG